MFGPFVDLVEGETRSVSGCPCPSFARLNQHKNINRSKLNGTEPVVQELCVFLAG